MRYSISLFFITIVFSCFLTGCGKDEKLTAFEENMTGFYQNIESIGKKMDAVDPTLDNAVDLMNANLEDMKQQFEALASMEIPPQFASIESLADDALEYMEEAASLYSMAYQQDSVIDSYVQAAGENYEQAMKRIEYISSLLQGEIPEGAQLIEGNGTEFEPYTE